MINVEKIKNESLKAVVNAPDKLSKAPLLLNYSLGSDEENKSPQKSIPQTPIRKSPMHLAISQSGKSKSKGAAALSTFKVDKFNSGMKNELLNKDKEEREKIKRMQEDLRRREEEELKRAGGKKEAVKNVLSPTYELDPRLNVYREQQIPPESIFMGLGWDETPDQNRRHYRRYYNDELENIKEIMPVPTPFHTYEVKRG